MSATLLTGTISQLITDVQALQEKMKEQQRELEALQEPEPEQEDSELDSDDEQTALLYQHYSQQEQQQQQQQKKKKKKHKKRKAAKQQEEAFYGFSGEEDSYDEFEAYRSDPEDAEPELPEGALPVVRGFEMDLPTDKKARAQLDREVNAIFRRIVCSKR
jgi:predicted Holliday junction resolvase-like endonuclease